MGTYSASLRAVGDTTTLPATVYLEDGQLSIAAGSHEIGSWSLADIQLEPLPNGYRLAAEGDQIIIELKELDAFREALSNGRFKRRLKLRGKENKTSRPARQPAKTDVVKPAIRTRPGTPAQEPRSQPTKKSRSSSDEGLLTRGLDLLDHGIRQGQKRFGPYLPEWMFSRAMVFILLTVFVVMLIFPVLFLITGGLIIAFGAVAYSDPMIASRWLPGRTQPPQVLIIGVGLLLLGVLVGVITS